MTKLDGLDVTHRRFLAHQRLELVEVESLFDCANAVRPLGVTLGDLVI